MVTLSGLSRGSFHTIDLDGQDLQTTLNNIDTSLNTTFTLQKATNSSLGGVQLGFTEDATARNYTLELSGNKAFVNVPWTETPYSLPTASATTKGGVKIGYTQNDKKYPVELDHEKMYVEVPWNNYSLPTATSTRRGGVRIGYSQTEKLTEDEYSIKYPNNEATHVAKIGRYYYDAKDPKKSVAGMANTLRGRNNARITNSGKIQATKKIKRNSEV